MAYIQEVEEVVAASFAWPDGTLQVCVCVCMCVCVRERERERDDGASLAWRLTCPDS